MYVINNNNNEFINLNIYIIHNLDKGIILFLTFSYHKNVLPNIKSLTKRKN